MATANQREVAKRKIEEGADDRSQREFSDRQEFSGRNTRQGEIILRRRWQRVVFIAGLAGIALVVILATCSV